MEEGGGEIGWELQRGLARGLVWLDFFLRVELFGADKGRETGKRVEKGE